jgi:HAD superfamily hydrolase (TIGR01549 family)
MLAPHRFQLDLPTTSSLLGVSLRVAGGANFNLACDSDAMRDNILEPYKAVIFDLDGTLVDSNEFHVDSWDRAFRQFGKTFSHEELRKQIGKGSDNYLPAFLTPDEMKRFGKELDQYRSDLFKKEYLPCVKPFPKERELYERIHHDGKHILLASSGKKPETEYYTKLLQIEDLIDGKITAEDADSSKPAPDIFNAALAKLGVSPNEAIVVGDTRFDIAAARKGGLAAIGFLSGRAADEKTLRKAGALAVFRDPADLLAEIEK